MREHIPTVPHPRFVEAIKLAGLRMLVEHQHQRMIIDIDQLTVDALMIFDNPEALNIERLFSEARELAKSAENADARAATR